MPDKTYRLSVMKMTVGKLLANLETVQPERLEKWATTLKVQLEKTESKHKLGHEHNQLDDEQCAEFQREEKTLTLCAKIINDLLIGNAEDQARSGIAIVLGILQRAFEDSV